VFYYLARRCPLADLKSKKPKTRGIAARVEIELYEKLKKDAEESRRSIAQQLALVLSKHYSEVTAN
jgi:hypothetical protein